MHKKVFIYLITFTINISLTTCSTNINQPIITNQVPYVVLNVGDIKQYKSDVSDLLVHHEIMGTVFRSDGQKVYAILEILFFNKIGYYDTLYAFIKDDFFTLTQLDTVDSNNINPFSEERVAKVHPKDNDRFLFSNTETDSLKKYFTVKMIDSLVTPAKTFYNVAVYKKTGVNYVNHSSVYYAPQIGHIGITLYNDQDTANILLSYAKMDKNEIGIYTKIEDFKKSNN